MNDIVTGAKPEEFTLTEFILAKNVSEVLHKKYPGHLWAVSVRQGLVFVHNLALSGRWGFVLKEEQIDNDYKAVMRAGGELLERYRMSRGRFKEDEYNNLRTDYTGNIEVDST